MSDGAQSDTAGPLPQQLMTMLFSVEDFDEKVNSDKENLCCIVVTSTLCAHSGIRKLRYPALSQSHGMSGQRRDGGEEEADEDDETGDAANASHDEEEDDEEDGNGEAGGPPRSFFEQVKRRLVTSERHLKQRRHVRFFHICACLEHETNIQPRMAKDIAFAVARRKPNAVELAELHKAAYADLIALLHHLQVSSTPTLLFFVRGRPISYQDLHPALGAAAAAHGVEAAGPVSLAAHDHLHATGANLAKWRTVFMNAVAVRNAMLKEHDAEVRAQAARARREARRQARLERKRQQALEGHDDEELEEEGDY